MRDNYPQPFGIHQCNHPNLIAGLFGDVKGGEEVAEANSERIASCVNALAGLNPNAISKAVKALEGLVAWRKAHIKTLPTGFSFGQDFDVACKELETALANLKSQP